MTVSYSPTQFQNLKTQGSKQNSIDSSDGEEFLWTVIELVAEGAGSLGTVVKVLKFLRTVGGSNMFEEDYAANLVPNPYFVVNGHDGQSPRTAKYLRNRGFKNLGSAAISLAGGLASGVTYADVGSALVAANALGSTGVHMVKLSAIGSNWKKSQTITGWVNAIQKAKGAKLAVRGVDLVGAVVPVPALGLATSAATAVAKLGIKVTLGKLIARTSFEIHWRAHVETKLSSAFGGGAGKPQGPASAIFYEIFTRRGATRIFGKYDISALINEPSGWLALNDKLLMM